MMEGDIVVGQRELPGSAGFLFGKLFHLLLTSLTGLDAPLANPEKLWPGGTVKYKFDEDFPPANKRKMLKAMAYITSKVSCIKFREVQGDPGEDFVVIRDRAGVCRSRLGRVGGEQELSLNG